MSTEHQHRPGLGRQTNKPFKHGKHASKREQRRINSGKAERKIITKPDFSQNKEQKRNTAKQLQEEKRQAALNKNRGLGQTDQGPPKLIALISLNAETNLIELAHHIIREATGEEVTVEIVPNKPTIFNAVKFKNRLGIIPVCTPDVNAVLDICKVEEFALEMMTCIYAQGLPVCLAMVSGLDQNPKKKTAAIKVVTEDVHAVIHPDTRIIAMDSPTDFSQVVRFLCTTQPKFLTIHDKRPYLMAHSWEWSPYADATDGFGSCCVTGYLRGNAPLDPNLLVHLTDIGDFAIDRIEIISDPFPYRKGKEGVAPQVFVSDPKLRESLKTEADVDEMENEQNLPSLKELREQNFKKVMKKVPKGTSAYQAAWIPDEESGEEGSESGEEDGPSDMMEDDQFEAIPEGSDDGMSDDGDDEPQQTRKKKISFADAGSSDEESRDLEAEQEDEFNYPDETSIPFGELAMDRFQNYRGLKSMRSSPWDPKQMLPLDYARIFQFSNWSRAKKRALTERSGVQPGSFVAIYLKNVHSSVFEGYPDGKPLLLSALLRYENKMSVVHFEVIKHKDYEPVITNKQELLLCSGFRRYRVHPVYSEVNPGWTRHKQEKFLYPQRLSLASIYGPITYPPASIMLFDENMKLAATGNLFQVNPDRILLKKIVLTGHPKKVNKRRAIVTDMFFHSDDVQWFKKIDLWTKGGKRGAIRDSVGEKGKMKCEFDSPIMNDDTVCMSLYKRVYPKWATMPTPPRREEDLIELEPELPEPSAEEMD